MKVEPALLWPIKRSFSKYTILFGRGQITCSGGASELESRLFRFELDDASDFDTENGRGTLKFRGEVRFEGHQGLLDVRFADPWVCVQDAETVVTVLDWEQLPADRSSRIQIASTKNPVLIGGIESDVFLDAAGSGMFNNAYELGSALDPLALTV